MSRALKGILIAGLLSTSFAASAQNWNRFPGILQRLEIGYSFIKNTGTYETHDRIFNELLGIDVDTTTKSDVKTSGGFAASIGTYFPLKRLGQKSMLTLNVTYLYSAMLWDFTSYTNSGFGSVPYSFSGATVQMSLPIGLDFKFGCDAITNKRIRFCTTLGAGIMPSYSATALDNNGPSLDPLIGFAPYAKFEAGIYAGMCFKIRALYAMGSIPYTDYKKSDFTSGEFTTSSKLTGKSNFNLGIIIMPFAYTWKKSEWFNTY